MLRGPGKAEAARHKVGRQTRRAIAQVGEREGEELLAQVHGQPLVAGGDARVHGLDRLGEGGRIMVGAEKLPRGHDQLLEPLDDAVAVAGRVAVRRAALQPQVQGHELLGVALYQVRDLSGLEVDVDAAPRSDLHEELEAGGVLDVLGPLHHELGTREERGQWPQHLRDVHGAAQVERSVVDAVHQVVVGAGPGREQLDGLARAAAHEQLALLRRQVVPLADPDVGEADDAKLEVVVQVVHDEQGRRGAPDGAATLHRSVCHVQRLGRVHGGARGLERDLDAAEGRHVRELGARVRDAVAHQLLDLELEGVEVHVPERAAARVGRAVLLVLLLLVASVPHRAEHAVRVALGQQSEPRKAQERNGPALLGAAGLVYPALVAHAPDVQDERLTGAATIPLGLEQRVDDAASAGRAQHALDLKPELQGRGDAVGAAEVDARARMDVVAVLVGLQLELGVLGEEVVRVGALAQELGDLLVEGLDDGVVRARVDVREVDELVGEVPDRWPELGDELSFDRPPHRAAVVRVEQPEYFGRQPKCHEHGDEQDLVVVGGGLEVVGEH
mmetsp:Transcript_3579/g.10538  ORF Transcript_3579/g.10538 Transcript_3579/m.10538 type:complete len:559 (-) Transcript_3579:230-1906(-)